MSFSIEIPLQVAADENGNPTEKALEEIRGMIEVAFREARNETLH